MELRRSPRQARVPRQRRHQKAVGSVATPTATGPTALLSLTQEPIDRIDNGGRR